MIDNFLINARNAAILWAKQLVQMEPSGWCILDTETTGLDFADEVIQIGVIDGSGNVLMDNQLIRPNVEISRGAFRVHGISEENLKDAPRFAEIQPALLHIARGRQVVIYNAAYDLRMLSQSAKLHEVGMDSLESVSAGVSCAMERYAEFIGEWNDYRGSFKWQRLLGGGHNAISDCLATLKIIQDMAKCEVTNGS